MPLARLLLVSVETGEGGEGLGLGCGMHQTGQPDFPRHLSEPSSGIFSNPLAQVSYLRVASWNLFRLG